MVLLELELPKTLFHSPQASDLPISVMTNPLLNIQPLALSGLIFIEARNYEDHRGVFTELWREEAYRVSGLPTHFVQDNLSVSRSRGTLRGIHFQKGDAAQGKLVRPLRGAIRDVAVDLRPQSPTRFQWVAVDLSAEKALAIFIPRGFGHAFLTLEDDTFVYYKADAPYAPGQEGSIRWNDPTLQIEWGSERFAQTPILSEKDAQAPLLGDWLKSGALG